MLASEQLQLVSFKLDESHHAIALSCVERVVHAVEVTRVPGAPSVLLGVMELAGEVLPVFSMRPRLHRPARWPDPSDQFLVIRTGRRRLVLMVDAVEGVLRCDQPPAPAPETAPHLRGVLGVEDAEGKTLMLIHDMEAFLSPAQEDWLHQHLGSPA